MCFKTVCQGIRYLSIKELIRIEKNLLKYSNSFGSHLKTRKIKKYSLISDFKTLIYSKPNFVFINTFIRVKEYICFSVIENYTLNQKSSAKKYYLIVIK